MSPPPIICGPGGMSPVCPCRTGWEYISPVGIAPEGEGEGGRERVNGEEIFPEAQGSN